MNPIVVIAALYLAKVIFISGLLFGYYRLFLRDRMFHQYNRFYLLVATLGSLILPLIHLPVPDAFPLIGKAPVLGSALRAIVPGDWKEPAAVMGVGAGAIALVQRRAADDGHLRRGDPALVRRLYPSVRTYPAAARKIPAGAAGADRFLHDPRTGDAILFSQPAFLE